MLVYVNKIHKFQNKIKKCKNEIKHILADKPETTNGVPITKPQKCDNKHFFEH